jgi:hypothetical protein
MPRRRRTARRGLVSEFDLLDFAIGPQRVHFQQFSDEEVLAAAEVAWPRWREQVMANQQPGRRGWGWWMFEAREPWPRGLAEIERLLELGELDDAEQDAIVAHGEEQIARYGLAWKIHGQHPSVAEANVILRHRDLPEFGFYEDERA